MRSLRPSGDRSTASDPLTAAGRPVHRPRSLAVFPGLGGYLELLVGELRQLGAAVVWLDTGVPGGLAPAGAEIVPLPAAPTPDAIFGAVRLLGATLRLQQLARGTAHAGGTYVDGFRVLRRVVQAAPDRFG